MNAYRKGEIYVASDVLWALNKVVKGMNANNKDPLESQYTVEFLATDILRQWVKAWHPELVKLRERRDAIDSEAESLIKTAGEKK